MIDQKPIRTFTLCDEENNKYKVNEFKIIAETSGNSIPTHLLTPSYFQTTDGLHIEFENNNYYLLDSNQNKTQLYSC